MSWYFRETSIFLLSGVNVEFWLREHSAVFKHMLRIISFASRRDNVEL